MSVEFGLFGNRRRRGNQAITRTARVLDGHEDNAILTARCGGAGPCLSNFDGSGIGGVESPSRTGEKGGAHSGDHDAVDGHGVLLRVSGKVLIATLMDQDDGQRQAKQLNAV